MARAKGPPKRTNERGNSAMLVVRVHKNTRKEIEDLAKDSGKSMSSLVDKAASRLTDLHKRPHIETLVDTIVTLAQQIEQDGANISTDPEASYQFHKGIARVLEKYTAPPAQETDTLKASALVNVNTALTLTQAGYDWSWKDSAWSKATLRGRK